MTLAIMFFALLALAVAGYTYFAHERLLESVLSSYAKDILQSFSVDLAISEERHHAKNAGRRSHSEYADHHLLITGPSLPGGVILILSHEGEMLGASPGVAGLEDIPANILPHGDGKPQRITHNGDPYFVVGQSLENTQNTIFFLIPQKQLLPSVANPYKLLVGSIVALIVCVLGLAWGLWSYLTLPLRKMAAGIDTLRWGREIFAPLESRCVWEVWLLGNVLRQQSQTALENELLKERYVRDVISIQERQQTRFSREMHDGPLQYVTAAIRRIQIASMLLRNIASSILNAERQDARQWESITENLSEAEKAAQFSADEIRDLCDEMSPSWLDLGFPSALTELTERTARHHKIPVNLTFSDNAQKMNLSHDESLALLRIFQEACSNAVRHGKAGRIDVELSRNGDDVIFSIRDNGAGFDASSINERELHLGGHRGIANMKERMRMMGGTLTIKTAAGMGCAITALLKRRSDPA
jgi:signal transduction histidine kinase